MVHMLATDVTMPVRMAVATHVRVSVAAEAGERHREQADGAYGKGNRIKIHAGA
jgi:hypothetical protein